MKLRKNRIIEREAINAARAFFESCGCIYQEIDTSNDYGKDAYLDLVEAGNVSGLCIALQVKGGEKYFRRNGYMIPVDDHTEIWKTSTVPIAGIVYDQRDGQLRWCNISEYLRANSTTHVTQIPVEKHNTLSPETLQRDFKRSFEDAPNRNNNHPLFQIFSPDEEIQQSCLIDCFGLGRYDARVFIVLRYIFRVLSNESLQLAVSLLSHLTPHPDIYWNSNNWIKEEIKNQVLPFFTWTEDEIIWLLSSIPWGQWGRGNPGEDLYMLLLQDKDIRNKMQRSAIFALNDGKDDVALTAMILTIYWAREKGNEKYKELVAANARFRQLDLAHEIESQLLEFGYIDIF